MPDDALRQHLTRAAAAGTKGTERLEALKAAAAYLAREERIKFDVDGAQCTYDAAPRAGRLRMICTSDCGAGPLI
jgi:hypothetical protein